MALAALVAILHATKTRDTVQTEQLIVIGSEEFPIILIRQQTFLVSLPSSITEII